MRSGDPPIRVALVLDTRLHREALAAVLEDGAVLVVAPGEAPDVAILRSERHAPGGLCVARRPGGRDVPLPPAATPEDLLRALRAAAQAPPARRRGPPAGLTDRELEVLELIDAGLSNRAIAERLAIRLPTVKNHVRHILVKVGARGRAEAAARTRALRSPAAWS